MLTSEENKRIAKELGICAHKYVVDVLADAYEPSRCAYCNKRQQDGDKDIVFDSRDGFCLIMEHGQKMDWWFGFTKTKAFVHNSRGSGVKVDYIGTRLGEELNRWLEERE